ncbi:MAG: efflux RND transporter periplasmic adaptor subunit [Fuerstiella sp.]|jgi:RND family efflux transporter MFP subunit|nr:efflux RND transporter periplasmic adaptor subunit [Fuerstiella sp.]
MLSTQSRAHFALSVMLCLVVACAGQVRAQPGSVEVARVIERELNVGHRVVGSVMPIQSSTVGTAVNGRVENFLVDVGDAVRKGDVLAELRTGTLEIELKAARAELTLRQEELQELRNGSRPEEISEARARMLAAKAIRQNESSNLTRLEQLVKRQAINPTDLDDARARAESTSQILIALQAALSRIESGPRAEQIAQAHARVALQEAQVELIEDRILKYTVRSPFDGFVTAEHTEVGEWVSDADPIADVIALEYVEILCNVPAEQALRLRRGRDIRIEFPELPGEVFTGRVDQVVPIADRRTRTFPVNIRLQNRMNEGRPLLLAGMLARAVLPTGDRTVMPLVPKDSLVLNGSQRSVFIVASAAESGSSAKVRSVSVTLGVSDAGLIQVKGELKAGDVVVVRGNERLRDGQEVSVSPTAESDTSVAD